VSEESEGAPVKWLTVANVRFILDKTRAELRERRRSNQPPRFRRDGDKVLYCRRDVAAVLRRKRMDAAMIGDARRRAAAVESANHLFQRFEAVIAERERRARPKVVPFRGKAGGLT